MESKLDASVLKINSVMGELFELSPDKLIPTAHLSRDLGLDSLDAIDLAMKFQTEFGINLSNIEMQSIQTLNDVYDLVQKHTPGAAKP